jgi:hypothetical protein
VYLVLILFLGVVSVCLTIFVLSLHFKPEEEKIPEWVKTLTNSCLIRVAWMKKCGSCSKGSKVDEAHLTDTTILKKLTVDEKNDLNTTEGKSDQELTWQHLSKIMDRVFFNIYISIIAIVTVMLFLVIFIAYYTS